MRADRERKGKGMGLSRDIVRREFLTQSWEIGWAGVIVLAAAQWPVRILHAAQRGIGASCFGGGRTLMLDKVTVSVFAEALGSAFRVRAEFNRIVDLELVEAKALATRSGAPIAVPRQEPFSILLRGPLEPILPQRIYALEHASLGPLELFLVPVGRDAKGICYEAVFN